MAKYTTIVVPNGALIIPEKEIKKTFKSFFIVGKKSPTPISFEKQFEKVMKDFSSRKTTLVDPKKYL